VKLGIIGGGVMGEAILSCLLSRGEYAATDVYVSEPNSDRRDFLTSTYGILTTDKNIDVTQGEVLLLAVKPQSFMQATQGLGKFGTADYFDLGRGDLIPACQCFYPKSDH
jgi:pyrroline-5-carboxylate reductase